MGDYIRGYLQINDQGHLIVNPRRNGKCINLYALTSSLVQRGIEPPILFRFDGIIQDRIKRLYKSFASAIEEYEYRRGRRR